MLTQAASEAQQAFPLYHLWYSSSCGNEMVLMQADSAEIGHKSAKIYFMWPLPCAEYTDWAHSRSIYFGV